MKSSIINHRPNYLLMLVSLAAIIVVTVFSIGLLHQFSQFIETTLGATAREANQYVSYGY